jgi:hypothetical protein
VRVVAALLTKAAEKGGENLADADKAAVRWLRDRAQTGDEEGFAGVELDRGCP